MPGAGWPIFPPVMSGRLWYLALAGSTIIAHQVLPPDVRARIREVTFDRVSFAETSVFQPAEHLPCVSYEGSYEDMTGKSHSLPGVVDDEVSEAALRRYLEMRGLSPDDVEE